LQAESILTKISKGASTYAAFLYSDDGDNHRRPYLTNDNRTCGRDFKKEDFS